MNALQFLVASPTTDRYTVALPEKPDSFFESFPAMLTSIMNIVLTIGVVAVLFYLIWGGIEYITSGGDKTKTEGARNKITSAIVGLIILVSAWAILQFVQTLLDIKIIT